MIETYDDFLSSSSCQRLYSALMNSVFRIGWGDSDELHHRQYPNLYAEYSTEELRKLKILDPVLNILRFNLTNLFQKTISPSFKATL